MSVIIPCYRSEACLAETVHELVEVFSRQRIPARPESKNSACRTAGAAPKNSPYRSENIAPDYRYQIILVNDGSPDRTWDVISSLCAGDRHIVGINLAENSGQSNAKLAAISFIRGNYAVFMDDDGQHPSDQIFPMIGKLNEGWHMVYAQFPEAEESAWRKALSFLNNIPVSILMRKPFRLRITSFFVLDAVGIRMIRSSRPAPFIGGTVLRKTRRVTGYPVTHRKRKTGSSTYTLKRLIKLWFALTRGLLQPEKVPEHVFIIADVLNPPPDRKIIKSVKE